MEAVVLGGGPAGSATALALARAHRSVVVIERSCRDSPRTGDTLPPEVRSPLVALGLWDRFLSDDPLSSPGTLSAWGSADLSEGDFIVNPHGCGWHADRMTFDAMLAMAVEEAGGKYLRSARLVAIERSSPRGWRLGVVSRGEQIRIHARLVADASGRASAFARRIGVRRIPYDRLVGLVASYVDPRRGGEGERRTLVEAVEDGWWYASPLPGGRRLAAFMTDADLMPRGRERLLRYWRDRLRVAPHSASLLGEPGTRALPRAMPAESARLERPSGDDWLAVGDAAATRDPLSSQGVYWALVTGLEAARAMDDRLLGDRESMKSYADSVEDDYDDYQQDRSAYYGAETRWAGSTFWCRRLQPFE